MAEFKRLTDDFSVAPQLAPEDFARAAAAGFVAVVNNRPDGEEPGQMTTAQAEAAAREQGLAYHHAPVVGGQLTMDAVETLKQATAEAGGPVLAYCRSGTRSATLWAVATAMDGAMGTADIVKAAGDAGYDLTSLAGSLDQLAQGGQSPGGQSSGGQS